MTVFLPANILTFSQAALVRIRYLAAKVTILLMAARMMTSSWAILRVIAFGIPSQA